MLYSVNLDFELVNGEKDTAKRYLKSIQKRFPSGESQPAVGFEYFKSGSFNGCLKTVVNSLGAQMEYYYKDMAIQGRGMI